MQTTLEQAIEQASREGWYLDDGVGTWDASDLLNAYAATDTGIAELDEPVYVDAFGIRSIKADGYHGEFLFRFLTLAEAMIARGGSDGDEESWDEEEFLAGLTSDAGED